MIFEHEFDKMSKLTINNKNKIQSVSLASLSRIIIHGLFL